MKIKNIWKSILCMLLCFAFLCSCDLDTSVKPGTDNPGSDKPENNKVYDYTYRETLQNLPKNWNPHNYRTQEENYPAGKISSGFYSIIYNDALHPVEGLKDYEGYVIVPEMASAMPEDITAEVRAAHPGFGIPQSADSGYAYRIKLNKDATWENGKPINAYTYVESMKRLLSPKLKNYRAADYYLKDFSIAGAEKYACQGRTVYISLSSFMAKEGIDDFDQFLQKHGNEKGGINWWFSFGAAYDWSKDPSIVDNPSITEDDINMDNFIECKDEVVSTPLALNQLLDFYIYTNKQMQGVSIEDARSWARDELYLEYIYPETVEFDTVGCYAEDVNTLVLVLDRPLKGFDLLYNLTSTWLVEPDLYDSCITKDGDVYTSTYNTSAETTISYGPYRLAEYTANGYMRFKKNSSWYGWTDGKHVYIDPKDGKQYQMFQTTDINVIEMGDASNEKDLFSKGELSKIELGTFDYYDLKDDSNVRVDPDETVFFLILNGHKKAIETRESAPGFDKATVDLETMTVLNFRKALALSLDRGDFIAKENPSRISAYGLISESFIYNSENGAKYRDTDQAKQVLCDFYSVDTSKYSDLDAAVDSITGFNIEKAKEFYTLAFKDAIEAGYITDTDGDGISDQTVTIEYSLSSDTSFMTRTIDFLNENIRQATMGTPFENRVKIVKSVPYNNEWSVKIKEGLSDTVLAGWTASVYDPYSLTELYTNPDKQYDAQWFDASTEMLTLGIDGKDVTMSLRKWSEALNGVTQEENGVEYNFGKGNADVETRLQILAAMEGEILKTYDYIPFIGNASKTLFSKQVYLVTDVYDLVAENNELMYLKYHMSDDVWLDFLRENGGKIEY